MEPGPDTPGAGISVGQTSRTFLATQATSTATKTKRKNFFIAPKYTTAVSSRKQRRWTGIQCSPAATARRRPLPDDDRQVGGRGRRRRWTGIQCSPAATARRRPLPDDDRQVGGRGRRRRWTGIQCSPAATARRRPLPEDDRQVEGRGRRRRWTGIQCSPAATARRRPLPDDDRQVGGRGRRRRWTGIEPAGPALKAGEPTRRSDTSRGDPSGQRPPHRRAAGSDDSQAQTASRSRAPVSEEGCRSLDMARASIWRIRSRVRLKCSPTSSRVRGSPRSRP